MVYIGIYVINISIQEITYFDLHHTCQQSFMKSHLRYCHPNKSVVLHEKEHPFTRLIYTGFQA